MDHVPRIQKRARSDLYMCQCQRARSILTVKTNLMVQVGAESVVHIVAVALDILSFWKGNSRSPGRSVDNSACYYLALKSHTESCAQAGKQNEQRKVSFYLVQIKRVV
jgi:hypothetical protein